VIYSRFDERLLLDNIVCHIALKVLHALHQEQYLLHLFHVVGDDFLCLLGDMILHIWVIKMQFLQQYHLNNNCYYRLWRNGLQVFVFPGYGRKSTTA